MLLDTCSATATTAEEGQEADKRADNLVQENSKSYPICKPEGHRLQGGKGPPKSCETLAGYKVASGGEASWKVLLEIQIESVSGRRRGFATHYRGRRTSLRSSYVGPWIISPGNRG